MAPLRQSSASSVGLLLIALGIYGYNVARQTHEIGIRMALGASRGQVLGMVMKRGALLIAIGVAAGLGASLAATRVLTAQVRGGSPNDPLTLLAVIAIVGITGSAACYFPARRATRVEPTVALRYE